MRIAAVLAGIFALLIIAFALTQRFLPAEEPFPIPTRIHFYKKPTVLLNDVNLKVYYVIKEDKKSAQLSDWQKNFDQAFREIVRFHSVQFLGKSLLTYDINPEPIVVSSTPDGDLFAKNPAELALLDKATPLSPALPDHYRVKVFIVEGSGSGGAPGLAYAPAEIFRNPNWTPVKESLIYHALGQAFGLPEGNSGVMGLGMFRPIDMTFLEPELVQKMGLLD